MFSELFYAPGAGFTQIGAPWERVLYESVDWIVGAAVVVSVGILLVGVLRNGPVGRRGKVAALLLVVLAVGPGLIVNGILKEHWGRARPRDVVEFGGDHRFTPAIVITDQCERNSSITAGQPTAAIALAARARPGGAPTARGARLRVRVPTSQMGRLRRSHGIRPSGGPGPGSSWRPLPQRRAVLGLHCGRTHRLARQSLDWPGLRALTAAK